MIFYHDHMHTFRNARLTQFHRAACMSPTLGTPPGGKYGCQPVPEEDLTFQLSFPLLRLPSGFRPLTSDQPLSTNKSSTPSPQKRTVLVLHHLERGVNRVLSWKFMDTFTSLSPLWGAQKCLRIVCLLQGQLGQSEVPKKGSLEILILVKCQMGATIMSLFTGLPTKNN